ncbi:hypothetical protein [Bradyrhizobium sp. JYMT SZCCT0180]|uniref:hypothetical protein n=1 Tax=Bradyrhizobium sp. JYMT SZCCT0180 TaxID=2807666 RepID=UPI001BAE443F|nr:hypothetical protein [Bradyrhizobium sp. JYMT SZCCT0180]MBR1212814.1 hypothetical protein [Bradyrhizobium sp. JYMT SZCCT0180]
MTRLATLVASLIIGAASMPALATQCTSPGEIAASRTRRQDIRQQLFNATDHEMACRAFAAAFVELVMARRVAATCVQEANRDSDINALDAEINAVNDLIAVKCRG